MGDERPALCRESSRHQSVASHDSLPVDPAEDAKMIGRTTSNLEPDIYYVSSQSEEEVTPIRGMPLPQELPLPQEFNRKTGSHECGLETEPPMPRTPVSFRH